METVNMQSYKYLGVTHIYTMLRQMGVSKLPVDGVPPFVLNGIDKDGQRVSIITWVKPLVGEAPVSATGYRQKRSQHRVRCMCPGCDADLSAGRLFQHVCKGK